MFPSSIGNFFVRVREFFFKTSTYKMLLLVIFIFSFKSVVVDFHPIPSGSMKPGVQIGDVIVVNKLAYGLRVPFTNIYLSNFSSPLRGDVVTFRPVDGGFNSWVKRIIAVGGDIVWFDSKNLFINGERVACSDFENVATVFQCEEYIEDVLPPHWIQVHSSGEYPGDNTSPYVVPEGHVFLAGDNRNDSHDSRFFGSLPVNDLYGEVFYVWSGGAMYLNIMLWVLIGLIVAQEFYQSRKLKVG